MQENQNFTFGGLDSDSDLRTVKSDRYIDGNDIEHFVDETNTIGGVRAMQGTSLAYNIGSITGQFIQFRIPFINANTDYQFRLFNSEGVQLLSASYTTSNAATLAASLTSSINAAIGSSVTATNITNAAANGGFFLTIQNYQNYTLTCQTSPNGVNDFISRTCYILQEAYPFGIFPKRPLAAYLIGDWQIVFSKVNDYNEIGVARQDVYGTWTYTKIIGSLKLGFPETQVIDIRAELLGNDRIGIYWTDNTNKPKVLYANTDFDSPNYSILAYSYSSFTGVIKNPRGIYYLNNIQAQTDLQIFNNQATVSLKEQLSVGGALKSGGKRYYVRFGINGTENVTPPNEVGLYTIVYKRDGNNNSNAVRVKGDITPTSTTKQNILRVNNCLSDVFNFLELICVEYQGEAQSATLVGRYDIDADTVDVKHTGLEVNSQDFDIGNLPNVTPVILKGKTNEIKKNRYNIANVELAVDDTSLEAIAQEITISSARKTIPRVGELLLNNTDTNVFSVSQYRRAASTGNSNPLSASGSLFDNQSESPLIEIDPNNRFLNGVYVADSLTAGFQKVSVSFSIQGRVVNSLPSPNINIIDEALNPNAVDFARVTCYLLNADDSVAQILADETDNGSNTSINFQRNLNFNVNMSAGQKIRTDYFVQGEATWNISGFIFSSTISSAASQNFGEQLAVEEYQKAKNVSDNVGYMLYEPYYFYIRYHYKNGYISSPYYIGSHTIGNSNEFGDSSPLTTPDGMPYVYYPVFNNINISSIKQQIVGFSIWRGVNPNKTILATGAILMPNELNPEGAYVGYYATLPNGVSPYGLAVSPSDNRRRLGLFVSPDNIHFNGELIEWQNGDEVIIKGQPTTFNSKNSITTNATRGEGSLVEYTGFTAQINVSPTGCPEFVISDAQNISFRQTSDRFLKVPKIFPEPNDLSYKIVLGGDGFRQTVDVSGVGMTFPVPINAGEVTPNQDYGFYISYYRRGDVPAFDTVNANVVDCNYFFKIQPETPDIINSVAVFGGDTYTQRNYMKIAWETLKYGSSPTTDPLLSGFVSFYTQNRVNTQMRHTVENGCVLFPADATSIVDYLSDSREEFYQIDGGYNKQTNNTLVKRPYNPRIVQNNKYPARIYYSQQRNLSSTYDGYRDIKPLDFRDLDGKNGQIVSLYDINDVMMTVQPFAITVLPYLTDVALSAQNGSIYIGNGGVYAQRESIISTYGSNIQTCVFRGFNRNGNATLYWFSEYVKKFFKYGREGVQPVSDNAKMRNFFLNRTKKIENEFDLVMGFDTKRDNLWITARAWNEQYNAWQFGVDYNVGDIVTLNDVSFWGYPLFFRALSYTNDYPTDSPNWEQIPLSEGEFYSLFTLLYNEKLNTFTTQCTALPERYFQYNNLLLAPNISASNSSFTRILSKVFQFGTGTDKFFEDTIFAPREFVITPVVNKIQNVTKRYLSLGLNTGEDLANFPTIDFATKNQTSTSIDFEQKNGNIFTAVEPDTNGEPLTGEYMTFRIVTDNEITILDAVSKMYYRPRLPR